jgi:aryl-alcohol dehydrogenase-like predicted oxidoreductase
MHYRRLGKTGFRISVIGSGLWGMGGWTGSNDGESGKVLQGLLDRGCNFFDTAYSYGNGRSDHLLGELIQNNRRKRIIAATKLPPKNLRWPASPSDPIKAVYPIRHVLRYAETTRKALGVDCIDLVQFHVWDDHWAKDPEWIRSVKRLKSDGIAKAVGISLNRWEPSNGLAAIKTGLVDTVQVIYNIFDQAPEDELFPVCKEMDVGIIARVPLDEGSLGGKMSGGTKFPSNDWRSRYFGPENLPPTIRRVNALEKIVPQDMTLPEMALRFILANPQVATTIVGMRKMDHIAENLKAADAPALPSSLVAAIKKHRWDRKVAPWAN